jgi:DNA-directed RNA polymerase specialized sigma24 family protein
MSASNIQASEWEGAPGLPFEWGADPNLWLYRNRTLAMLYRFFRLSMEAGRLPSILGQEFFRNQVTSYNVSSFEDVVIFVHDVERCIDRLDPVSKDLIGRIALQGYSQDEAARLIGCSRRTVGRRFPEALDELSEIFLRVGILTALPEPPQNDPEACQEGEEGENSVTM